MTKINDEVQSHFSHDADGLASGTQATMKHLASVAQNLDLSFPTREPSSPVGRNLAPITSRKMLQRNDRAVHNQKLFGAARILSTMVPLTPFMVLRLVTECHSSLGQRSHDCSHLVIKLAH